MANPETGWMRNFRLNIADLLLPIMNGEPSLGSKQFLQPTKKEPPRGLAIPLEASCRPFLKLPLHYPLLKG
jgi:hypothetical protein